MSNVAITGMPGYPGAGGTVNALDATAYVHGVQNQGGTMVDVAFNLETMLGQTPNSIIAALMLTWFNSLPTTEPGTSGVLWNNNGSLAQS